MHVTWIRIKNNNQKWPFDDMRMPMTDLHCCTANKHTKELRQQTIVGLWLLVIRRCGRIK